ncbi:addiction module protein [Crenothrix sp.]|uniref:addiction module protein n=1 Tax=Crenothrix sp. TaxID=3100433 RepID=UPI00374D4DB1
MKTKELIAEAVSLPVEERALIVDSLLRSLNTPESAIDKKWVAVAKNRLQQLRTGEVTAISSEEVFKKIAARFQL